MTSTGAPPTLLSPFKGLAPYEDTETDALLFFGRERDEEIIAANLMVSRLTVLYGPSGVGKSSVLQAGVARRIRAQAEVRPDSRPDCAVVVFSAWSADPVTGLVQAVCDAVEEAGGVSVDQQYKGVPMVSALRSLSEQLDGDLFLILDQVEELFLYHAGADGPGTFAHEFPEAVADLDLRAHFLLSIRDDALAQLDRFKGRMPNLFSNYLRLDRLDRRGGRAAITGPLERYNLLVAPEEAVHIEGALVEAVLDQVTVGRVELGRSLPAEPQSTNGAGRIEAPYLQLVLQRLWEAEQDAHSTTLRLETLIGLGGAAEIVEAHLERALSALTPEQRDLAAITFNYLVTPSGTKIAHRAADLAQYTGAASGDLEHVLSALGAERILRSFSTEDETDGVSYEIFHDVLAQAVLAWRGEHEADRTLEQGRREADRKHRRLLAVVAASLLGLAIAVGLAVFALTQRTEARSQASLAQSRELAATALARLPDDPELGLLLALEAARTERTPQAESALRDALLASRVRLYLGAQEKPISQAGFAPNGRLVATAGEDGTARVFDAATGESLRAFEHEDAVESVAFSPDSARLLTASKDGTAQIWDLASGISVMTYRHDGPVLGASFSSDGGRVLSWSADGTARIWSSTAEAIVLPSDGPVLDAAFSPDGAVVLTAGNDGFARLFDAETGRLLHTLEHEKGVTRGVFSPDGRLIVTAARERLARIWETETGRLVYELGEHEGVVTDVAFAPDGRFVVTTSRDGAARVWDVATGTRHAIFLGHKNLVLAAGFSPDGAHVITVSADRSARIWATEKAQGGPVLLGHSDTVESASFSPDGSTVVTASADGTARVWDASTELILQEIARPGPIAAASVSRDRDELLVVAGDTAQLLRADTGQLIRAFEHPGLAAADFGPDSTLATAGEDGVTQVWDQATGTVVRTVEQDAPATAVAMSRDGNLLITGGADGSALVRDARSGATLHVLAAPDATRIDDVAVDPDGELIATADDTGAVLIWESKSGALLRALRGHRNAVSSVSFSDDGARLVTASLDTDARVWDVETGETIHVLRGHFGPVEDASFSPDGRWVVTAGPISAGLWDAGTGRAVAYLRGHPDLLTAALFAPDGKRIITTGLDGTVRAYNCDICGSIEALEPLAEARLEQIGRQLTPEERAEFVED